MTTPPVDWMIVHTPPFHPPAIRAHATSRYAIESGKFDVLKKVGAKNEKINAMGAGQTFGELALLYGAKRSATVLCTEKASLWALDRSTFRFYRAHNESRMKNLAVEVLAKVPLLKDLERPQLSRAAEVSRTVDFKENDVIIHKGELGKEFYILLEGVSGGVHPLVCTQRRATKTMAHLGAFLGYDPLQVVICTEASLGDAEVGDQKGAGGKMLPKSSTKVVGGIRLKSGDWFGEIALLTDGRRTANVIADSSVCSPLSVPRSASQCATRPFVAKPLLLSLQPP